MNKTVEEVTEVLMEEYFGVGSTPETALDSLSDDMAQNRIDIGVFNCTPHEMMQAIGNVLRKIYAGKKHEVAHWQHHVLALHNNPEDDWWFSIR